MAKWDYIEYLARNVGLPICGQCNGDIVPEDAVVCRVQGCSDSEAQFYHRICIAAHRAYYHAPELSRA